MNDSDIDSYKAFARKAHPLNWYEVSKLLHENAQVLYSTKGTTIKHVDCISGIEQNNYTTNRSVFLLSGLALENLIKAFLIYENPSYIKNGKLANQIKSHKLSNLQQRCNKIPAKVRSKHVFEKFENGIESWARYPCGINFNSDTLEKSITDKLWNDYNKVYFLYSKKLETLLIKKWTDPYGEVGFVRFN